MANTNVPLIEFSLLQNLFLVMVTQHRKQQLLLPQGEHTILHVYNTHYILGGYTIREDTLYGRIHYTGGYTIREDTLYGMVHFFPHHLILSHHTLLLYLISQKPYPQAIWFLQPSAYVALNLCTHVALNVCNIIRYSVLSSQHLTDSKSEYGTVGSHVTKQTKILLLLNSLYIIIYMIDSLAPVSVEYTSNNKDNKVKGKNERTQVEETYLEEDSSGQTGCHNGFCNPAGSIGC